MEREIEGGGKERRREMKIEGGRRERQRRNERGMEGEGRRDRERER